MTPKHILAVLHELIDENPFAVRATLSIAEVEFTRSVSTLAVTCEERPRLLINDEFISLNCQTEAHVKAVLCHEYLHVLLRHTESRGPLSRSRHLAMDAVINAIIHRTIGETYSSMMGNYYKDVQGARRLLRPPREDENVMLPLSEARWPTAELSLRQLWRGLYEGQLNVDDIEALMSTFAKDGVSSGTDVSDLLGNHEDWDGDLPDVLVEALNRSLKEMNGHGIWRNPKSRGVGAHPYEALMRQSDEPTTGWERTTLKILRQHIEPDKRATVFQDEPVTYRIPVLSSGDRRAFMNSLWLPYIPDASWTTTRRRPQGTTQIYLDVSGSMYAEMPHIVRLLGKLQRHIHKPLWAFSDEVAPATIRNGQLVTNTSGGTSMTCVLEHVIATRPASAVVVTDGFIESLQPALVRRARACRLHVLLSRDGNASELQRAGLPYTQLERLPNDTHE